MWASLSSFYFVQKAGCPGEGRGGDVHRGLDHRPQEVGLALGAAQGRGQEARSLSPEEPTGPVLLFICPLSLQGQLDFSGVDLVWCITGRVDGLAGIPGALRGVPSYLLPTQLCLPLGTSI